MFLAGRFGDAVSAGVPTVFSLYKFLPVAYRFHAERLEIFQEGCRVKYRMSSYTALQINTNNYLG